MASPVNHRTQAAPAPNTLPQPRTGAEKRAVKAAEQVLRQALPGKTEREYYDEALKNWQAMQQSFSLQEPSPQAHPSTSDQVPQAATARPVVPIRGINGGVQGNNNTCALDTVLMALALSPIQIPTTQGKDHNLAHVIAELRRQGSISAQHPALYSLHNAFQATHSAGHRETVDISDAITWLERTYKISLPGGLVFRSEGATQSPPVPDALSTADLDNEPQAPFRYFSVNQIQDRSETAFASAQITSVDFMHQGQRCRITDFMCRENTHWRLFHVNEDGSLTYQDSMATQENGQNIPTVFNIPAFRQFLETLPFNISRKEWNERCTRFFTPHMDPLVQLTQRDATRLAQEMTQHLANVKCVVVEMGKSYNQERAAAHQRYLSPQAGTAQLPVAAPQQIPPPSAATAYRTATRVSPLAVVGVFALLFAMFYSQLLNDRR